MKALLINAVCGIGSTGRICIDLAKELETQGYEVKIAYGRECVPEEHRIYAVRIGTDWDVRIHGSLTRLFDIHGTGLASQGATKKFLTWADEYDPDLLWLHNLHGYYLNYEILFAWIRQRQASRKAAGKPLMEIKWTLHDCWAFTGHCAYFTYVGCEKWRTGCYHCPQRVSYPASRLRDGSKDNYLRRKAAFTGVKGLNLITPSQWLAELVRESFLNEYSVEVQNNRIDTEVFKPTPSDFRQRYGIHEVQTMILGVASDWSARKGLQDFVRLAQLWQQRSDWDSFIFVLVGIAPDSKQARRLRADLGESAGQVLLIQRTDSAEELAAIYTAADVFLNTTYEENYPSVNLEAEACGTRVITYDTGGCAETIRREDSRVIPTGALERAIELIATAKRKL